MPWRESEAEVERAFAEIPMVIAAPRGDLFGIFTPPAPAAAPAGRCVVLLTRPRSHRNRMWVEAARRLAARGFAAFRFDYHGAGDSTGESAFLDPNHPYRDDAVAVLRELRSTQGQLRFVLYGMCFDARTALSCFLDEAAAIDGLVFVASPVMDLAAMEKTYAERRGWGQVFHAMRSPRRWRGLLRLSYLRHAVTVVSRMARRSTVGASRQAQPLSPSFLEPFRALTASRARALFLYGAEDREYASFRVAEQSLWPALSAAERERLVIEVWPGEIHGGMLQINRQREILERCLRWIEALHPEIAAADARAGVAPARS